MANNCKIIAIDGVGGAGKTTVAFALAKHLKAGFLPSGSLYRFIAWRVQSGASVADALSQVASLQFPVEFPGPRVYFQEQDISRLLQKEKIGMFASAEIAPMPDVREGLLPLQRSFAKGQYLVCEGRDMSSVVFPDAQLSIYLTATVDVRSRRRGISEHQLSKRDEQDLKRELAPLGIHPRSHIIDTSGAKISQIVEKALLLLGKS